MFMQYTMKSYTLPAKIAYTNPNRKANTVKLVWVDETEQLLFQILNEKQTKVYHVDNNLDLDTLIPYCIDNPIFVRIYDIARDLKNPLRNADATVRIKGFFTIKPSHYSITYL